MGDEGIVVVTITGGADDKHRVAEVVAREQPAGILEVRAERAIPPDTLTAISEIAADNDMELCFRDV